MKAGTIASVVAYTYLFKYREQLGGSVALCAVSDEETGGKFGTRFLLEDERWRGDVMINAEPAGTGTIRFAEKGTLRLTFKVRTEGAHGAYTHKSESAILIAARLIEELGKVEDIVPEISPELREYMTREEVKRAVDECMGSGAADIMLKATLNIGVIRGGLKVNMIPSDCVFEADIRLPVGMSRIIAIKVIEEILEWYPQATMEIQEAASNPSTMCSYTHPMIDILARNAAKVMGKTPVAIPSLGATDCKFYRYRGIPAYIFGVSPESMASKNESIDIEEYLTVLKTHTLAGWEYLGGDMNEQAN
jgi:acetylornithine deacetylase/succinyl-diaminopimelate desuccinylase-like protein